MKKLLVLLLIAFGNTFALQPNYSSKFNDYQIASAVRKAVREADSTLLQVKSLGHWRDYLKIAAMELKLHLQPLVLIKFDEDISFRNQLKTIIEWENRWQKKETNHFIYYYRWDQPPPDILMQVQDAHFNEIASHFKIDAFEKIPYRYDLAIEESKIFPYEDLRGGIVSSQPLDLHIGALAAFYIVNSEPAFILKPLSKIYGNYYQNPATSRAYYEKSLNEISKKGYISSEYLVSIKRFANTSNQEWYSAFAFVYEMNQSFTAPKIMKFISQITSEITSDEFQKLFRQTFDISLPEFENPFRTRKTAKKL